MSKTIQVLIVAGCAWSLAIATVAVIELGELVDVLAAHQLPARGQGWPVPVQYTPPVQIEVRARGIEREICRIAQQIGNKGSGYCTMAGL